MSFTNIPKNIEKILVVRNDKLGDLLVSFSTFALLKKNLPNTEIHVLVSNYTAPMAEMCEFIDQVIIDPASLIENQASNSLAQSLKLLPLLKQQQYGAIISLFSSLHVGIAALIARIPFRIAPATKLCQIFYNHRISQHRSRSEKPEHRYNQELAEYFLLKIQHFPFTTVKPPFLSFNSESTKILKLNFMRKHTIPDDHLLVFIHPGSGGSAVNLSTTQFTQLANNLQGSSPITIVVSYGPNEEDIARLVYQNIKQSKVLYKSNEGLKIFSQHLQFADCFISGSTGPLHIAGVLNRPTAAFYTRRRSATALRWQTLNTDDKRLSFSPPESGEPEDMMNIDILQAAEKINKHYLDRTE